MKIIYISPNGCQTPLLFSTFKERFAANGISETDNIHDADIAFIDLFSNVEPIDADLFNKCLERRIPLVFFDATDYGAMSKEVFHSGLFDSLSKTTNIVYFMRKMDKTISYPAYVHPLELIQYPTHNFKLVGKYELFNRHNDICFIGNTSPTRANLLAGLMKYKTFHIDCQFTTQRISHEDWLNRHRNAKIYIEACGGGFGSERPFQLSTISVQLRNKSNLLRQNDFTDMVDCIEVNETPTEKDAEKILSVLNDMDKLYELYINGANRMRDYFNAEVRANYIINILKQSGIC